MVEHAKALPCAQVSKPRVDAVSESPLAAPCPCHFALIGTGNLKVQVQNVTQNEPVQSAKASALIESQAAPNNGVLEVTTSPETPIRL